VLTLLHTAKEKHGVKSRLFVDWDMGTPLAVYKVRSLLKNLLYVLGFSQEKTPYSFKYVAMSYLVNQNVSIDAINEAARYATGSKMVRDRYAMSAAQMRIHKLLAEAAAPIVDTRVSGEGPPTPLPKGTVSSISSREEHLTSSSKGSISDISSKEELLIPFPKVIISDISSKEEHLLPSSKGSIMSKRTCLKNTSSKPKNLIILSTFIPKSCTLNSTPIGTSNTRHAAFNKCNVTIVEVIKKEKPEYILPDSIYYPSSEDECGNINETVVSKRNKKSSKNTGVLKTTPSKITPNEHVSNEHVSSNKDSDSDIGLFS
jgi:hypothetical protein